MRFVLAVVIALPLLAAGAAQPAAPAVEIPFDFKTYQPIAPVRVNGGRPVPFVFDTGASINVVGESIAAEMGITADGPAQTITGGGDRAVAMRNMGGVRLAAAGFEWSDQRVSVVPIGAKHYGGFIGAPILMRYAVQFDFHRGVLRLIDPDEYAAPASAERVPFELQADLPVVRAYVDAGTGPIEARLMVDTGAGSVVVDLNRPFVDRHGLVDALKAAAPSDRPAGIGGTAPFLYGTGRRLVLGGLTIEEPRLGLSRATLGSSSRAERDGVIGNQVLRNYLTTFDYRRRVLVLEKPRS